MASDVVGPPSVLRRAVTQALVTIVLAGGVSTAVTIIGNQPTGAKSSGTGAVLSVWANSGAQVAQMNSSGSLTASGNLIVGHGKTGSGKILISGSDGGGLCYADGDGTGCTCTACNNGVCVDYVGTASECAAETHR